MSKIFKKLEKKCKKKYTFAFLASGCSSVASHGGERGQIGGGGGGQYWGGGQQRGGGGAIGGSTVGVSSTSKNRTSHHKYKYKSPKQFGLKQS